VQKIIMLAYVPANFGFLSQSASFVVRNNEIEDVQDELNRNNGSEAVRAKQKLPHVSSSHVRDLTCDYEDKRLLCW
jgi:hypothetical protein